MQKTNISLITTSIPMFILAACGFPYQSSSPFISELAKYYFMSWWLIGFILIKLAKESEAKRMKD